MHAWYSNNGPAVCNLGPATPEYLRMNVTAEKRTDGDALRAVRPEVTFWEPYA
jgi:hypothetical protein